MESEYEYIDEINCPIKRRQKSKKSAKELSNIRKAWRVYLHDK